MNDQNPDDWTDLQDGLLISYTGWFDPGDRNTPPDGEEYVESVEIGCPETYRDRLEAAGLPTEMDPLDYYEQVLA